MTDNQNPLSPHLQIYRWHISSLISITHRISGVINLFTLILLSTKNYQEAIYFFEDPLFRILIIALFSIGFFHAKIIALTR